MNTYADDGAGATVASLEWLVSLEAIERTIAATAAEGR